MAGFTGDGTDFHYTVINLRNFIFQQASQEIAVPTRKQDLQALWRVLDFVNISTNAVMNAEAFARNHILAHQRAFSLVIEADGRLVRVDGLDNARNNLTNLLAIILELQAFFCITDFLLDGLAGGL